MRRLMDHRFRRQTLTLWLCLGVLVGLGWARTGQNLSSVYLLATLTGLLIGWRKHSWLALISIVVLGIWIGVSRGALYMQKQAAYQDLTLQNTSLIAYASTDAVYGSSQQLVFQADRVELADGQQLAGKIQLSGFGVNAVFQGDKITASGKIYPGRGSIQGYMSYADLTVVARHTTLVESIRQKFTAGMQTALPEPLAPFAMGLLIGQRATLPAGVKQDLLMVGLTHIIAVSGYNLTIILHASRRLLAKRSKRMSTWLSFSLIAVFLLLAGASASIVRAAIVSVLSIVTAYYGREMKPLNLLAIAAAITAWANPFYIWGDLSWYLSFLAFYGVMVLSPLVEDRLGRFWRDNVIFEVALETVCAETMSLPIILYSFGQISLIGLPANILITSLVPLAMLLSLIAGLAGMLAGGLAGWLAWPALLLLNYMLDLAHIMAKLPGVFKQNRSFALSQMLTLYGLILIVTGLLYYKTKTAKRAIITDRDVRT
jgi:ComEC/Rec2-related protein